MAEETPAFAQATSAKESAPETPIAPIITPVELLIGIPPRQREQYMGLKGYSIVSFRMLEIDI